MSIEEIDFLDIIGKPEDKKDGEKYEDIKINEIDKLNNIENKKIKNVKEKDNEVKNLKKKDEINNADIKDIKNKIDENKTLLDELENSNLKTDFNVENKSYEKVVQLQKEILRNIIFIDKQFNRIEQCENAKNILKYSYAKLEYLKERTNCLEILYRIVNDNPDIVDDSDVKDLIDFVSKVGGN